LAAALLIPPIVYFIWVGGLPFLAAVLLIVLVGLHEFYGLIKDKGAHPLERFGMVAGASLPIISYLGNEYHATIVMTAVLLGIMVDQLRKGEVADSLASISGTFFGVFYVGWLMSHAVVLRNFSEVVIAKWGPGVVTLAPPEVGRFYLFTAVASVACCDAGAFFVGRAYGRRKLAPAISPAKTVEGALGGVAASIFGALVVHLVFVLWWPEYLPHDEWFAWLMTCVTGVILAAAGIVGDLVESLLKRDAHVKDTGHLIPGSGGVLDRIDSHLLAIPALYYVLLAFTYMRLDTQ